MGVITCSSCGSTSAPVFISIGGKASICIFCKNSKSKSIKDKVNKVQSQQPRIFTRAICLTHHCGTYNLTYMSTAHQMEDCDIYYEQTLGVLKPKTFGGLNGDISRKHFQSEINEFVRLNTNAKNYVKFKAIERQLALSRRSKIKISYDDMSFYKRNISKFRSKTFELPS